MRFRSLLDVRTRFNLRRLGPASPVFLSNRDETHSRVLVGYGFCAAPIRAATVLQCVRVCYCLAAAPLASAVCDAQTRARAYETLWWFGYIARFATKMEGAFSVSILHEIYGGWDGTRKERLGEMRCLSSRTFGRATVYASSSGC